MRILITGPTGFIGKHVINALRGNEHKIALLDKCFPKRSPIESKTFSFIEGGLENLDPLKPSIIDFSPEVCVHLAWQGIPDYSLEISRLNLNCSLELIDFLTHETDCKKIIISGSCFEYGKTTGICKESDPVQTTSYIAWAKQSLYNYSLLLCKQTGINLIWFRFFYVYGPGQREGTLIPSLVKELFVGKRPNIHDPLNSNDFIYVGDIANAIRLAVEKDVDSGIYNLGSGKATSVLDVCKIVEQSVTRTTCISDNLKKQNSSNDHVCFWSDISKAENNLGWRPRYSLENGIQEYLKSVRSENIKELVHGTK